MVGFKRCLFGMAGLAASLGLAVAQSPVPPAIDPADPLAVLLQAPKTDQDKKGENKGTQPPLTPPVTPPATPPLTFPAGMGAGLGAGSATTAAILAKSSNTPPVFGDFLTAIFGNTFSTYLTAFLPNGQTLTIRPGQTVVLPIGTTFDRPVATQTVTTIIPGNPNVPGGHPVDQIVPALQVTGTEALAHSGGISPSIIRGSFKIAENESPRPADRIYATYNFFSDVNPGLGAPELRTWNVHRETFGLEKAFLDGNASIGLRLPLLQVTGPNNVSGSGLGDLSIVFKYALLNEGTTSPDGTVTAGNVLSGGMVVTAPTGRDFTASSICPVIHPTVLQPWVGGIAVADRGYVQGFSSLAVPLDARDAIYFFNSVQMGYYLYRAPQESRWITSVTPVVECHVNTPLNHRGQKRFPIGAFDTVTITAGATFGLGQSSALNLGVNSPVTGPKPYVVEAMAQLNIRY